MPFSLAAGRAAARIGGPTHDIDIDRDRPDHDQARRFRTLIERARPAAERDDASGEDAFGPPMRESIVEALAGALANEPAAQPGLSLLSTASERAGTHALKVRLTSGPLAGSELEVGRQGGQLTIDIKLAPRFATPGVPDESDARRRATRLAASLAAQFNASVSVEYLDDRPAQA